MNYTTNEIALLLMLNDGPRTASEIYAAGLGDAIASGNLEPRQHPLIAHEVRMSGTEFWITARGRQVLGEMEGAKA